MMTEIDNEIWDKMSEFIELAKLVGQSGEFRLSTWERQFDGNPRVVCHFWNGSDDVLVAVFLVKSERIGIHSRGWGKNDPQKSEGLLKTFERLKKLRSFQ